MEIFLMRIIRLFYLHLRDTSPTNHDTDTHLMNWSIVLARVDIKNKNLEQNKY